MELWRYDAFSGTILASARGRELNKGGVIKGRSQTFEAASVLRKSKGNRKEKADLQKPGATPVRGLRPVLPRTIKSFPNEHLWAVPSIVPAVSVPRGQ